MLAASCWIHIKYLWVEMQLPSDISKKATWYVPCLLTFCLPYVSGVSSDNLSGILSAISLKILCGRGPAGNTLILCLLSGPRGEDCDLSLAVEVRRRKRTKMRRRRRRRRRRRDGWHKIQQPSPDRWGKNSLTMMQKMMTLYDTKKECFHYSSSRLSTTSSSFFPSIVYLFQLEDIKSMMIPAVIARQMPSCFQAWQSLCHVSWERVTLIQRPHSKTRKHQYQLNRIQKLEVSSLVQPVRY